MTVSAEIEATPDAVFAVLTDPASMPDWVNGIQSAEWAEGSSASRDGKIKMLYRYGRRSHNITVEITAIEPNSVYEFHTIEGPYPIEARFELTPSGNVTNLSYTQNALSDSKLAALGFILSSWIAKPMVRRILRKDLVKLNAIVTGRSEDTSPA